MHNQRYQSRLKTSAPTVILLTAAFMLVACSSGSEPSPPPVAKPTPPADIHTALVGKWKSITEFRYHQPSGEVYTADLYLEFFPDGRFQMASQSRDGQGQDVVGKNDRAGTYKIVDASHIQIEGKGKPETWQVTITGDELLIHRPDLPSDTVDVYNRVRN